MRTITHEIGTKTLDGKKIPIVRNYFLHEDDTNYLTKAQSYFTKDQKKQAKLQHRAYLRSLIRTN